MPKPGIVTPIMPFRSKPSLSNVRVATNRANVESNPPEIPITAVRQWVCSNRLARPDTWIAKMYNKYYDNIDNREKIRNNLTSQFGDLSGYAQQYLFNFMRAN